jgi:hypothetical protein
MSGQVEPPAVGVDRFVRKPFLPRYLVDVVSALCP